MIIKKNAIVLLAIAVITGCTTGKVGCHWEPLQWASPGAPPAIWHDKDFLAAQQAGSTCDWSRVVGFAETLIERYPNEGVAHFLLGNAYLEQLQYENALPPLRRATGLDPGSVQPWFELGLAATSVSNSEESVTAFRKAAELNPSQPVIWKRLAEGLRIQNKNGEAIEAYRHALDITPNDAELWFELGRVMNQMGWTDGVIQALQRSLSINPDGKHPTTRILLGHALIQQGKNHEAESVFRQGIRIEPQNAELWVYLGATLFNQGKREEAIKACRRSTDLNHAGAAVWYLLAAVYQDNGMEEETNEALKQLKRLDPEAAKQFEAMQQEASPAQAP